MQIPPSVLTRRVVYKTPWFELLAKEGVGFDQPYFVFAAADCVTVLPVTLDGVVVFIRQYRPALEAFTLELPSGHVDPQEEPAAAARRELREETGHQATKLTLLGCLSPDTGRTANKLWTFVASVQHVGEPEPGVELDLRPLGDVARMVREGELPHALDLAVLMQAAMGGHLPLFG